MSKFDEKPLREHTHAIIIGAKNSEYYTQIKKELEVVLYETLNIFSKAEVRKNKIDKIFNS